MIKTQRTTRLTLLVISLIFSQLHAQSPLKGSIGYTTSLFILYSRNYDYQGINFDVEFFDGLSVGVQSGIMFPLSYSDDDFTYYGEPKSPAPMTNVLLGMDVSYRFLKNSIVAPEIQVNFGGIPYTSLKDRTSPQYFPYFNYWLGYTDANAFLSIRTAPLTFKFGIGAKLFYYSINSAYADFEKNVYWTYSSYSSADQSPKTYTKFIGTVVIQATYSFPFKSKKP